MTLCVCVSERVCCVSQTHLLVVCLPFTRGRHADTLRRDNLVRSLGSITTADTTNSRVRTYTPRGAFT